MSVSSKPASSPVSSRATHSSTTHSSTAHPFVAYPFTVRPSTAHSIESAGIPAGKDVMVNRSPEQLVANHRFEMPLFPGHQKRARSFPQRVSRPQNAQKSPFSYPDSREIDASDVAVLKKQQADFARYSEEQAKRSQSAIESLQQQLISQSVQNKIDQRQMQQQMQQQMQNDWNRQFTTFTQTALQQPLTQQPNVSNISYAEAATIPQSSARKRTLSHIPTTYQVPKRTQVRWVDRLLSWVPKFLWLFFLGIALSVLCAIALSSSGLAPTGLLSSLSFSIRSVVPYLFVLSVVSLGITAVWDTFR